MLAALAAGPRAAAEDQCKNVQDKKTPKFDAEAGECSPLSEAKEKCEPISKDVDDSKKRSKVSCEGVQDAAEDPGSCGPSQRYTHACDAAYNGKMKGVTGAAAGCHRKDKDGIEKKRKTCKESVEAAEEKMKDDEKCKGKEAELDKLKSGLDDTKSYEDQLDQTAGMFDQKSQEFGTNQDLAQGYTANDNSEPASPPADASGSPGSSAPSPGGGGSGGGMGGGATSPTPAQASSDGAQSVGDPMDQGQGGGMPSASPSTVTPPQQQADNSGGQGSAAGASPVAVSNGATGPTAATAGSPATTSYYTTADRQSTGAGTDLSAGSRTTSGPGATAAPAPAAPGDVGADSFGSSSNGLRDHIARNLASAGGTYVSSGGGSSAGSGAGEDPAALARAGIAPAELRRPASAGTGGDGGSSAGDSDAASSAQSEVLSPFAKPLSDPKISLAGSETDRVIRSMLGQAEAAAGTDPGATLSDGGVGDQNGPSLWERTHAMHERSLRRGRVRGLAIR